MMIAAVKHRKANPCADTYEDVRRLIYKVCHDFIRRNGGDFDEAVSEANVAYMRAYESWNANGAASFPTYLSVCVYRRLLDNRISECRTKSVWAASIDARMDGDGASLAETTAGATPAEGLDMESYSPDAREVIRLVLDGPAELMAAVEAKGGEPRNWRSTLREYLRDMGWGAARVAEAFAEIGG